ncbi:MAG: indolepyruvate oxidoreductase subunit beta [Candidatus Jordarchaeum sp.]|uniref:indolepyruvate oxidoreductase subunit beta n=1 Tax=Candidatus Jordarchaeum sp. TaxID=2823881 RepID=UPI004049C2CF
MKKVNVYICGVGGQGTMTLGQLLKEAGLVEGMVVVGTESRGASQREGAVDSHVRFAVLEKGEKFDERRSIHSSLIPVRQADLYLSMEMAETLRNIKYVSEDGLIIMNRYEIWPPQVRTGEAEYPPLEKVVENLKKFNNNIYVVNANQLSEEKYGDYSGVNMIFLGMAMATGKIPVMVETVEKVIRERLWNPEKNIEQFRLGLEEGKKILAAGPA